MLAALAAGTLAGLIFVVGCNVTILTVGRSMLNSLTPPPTAAGTLLITGSVELALAIVGLLGVGAAVLGGVAMMLVRKLQPSRPGSAALTLVVLAAAALAIPPAVHAQAPVAIPNSPAGTLLKQWLDAFNRADSAGLDAFDTAHNPRVNAASAQNQLRMARASGGLELVRIISAEPAHIVFAARAKSGGTELRGSMEVMDGDPSQIKTFGVQRAPVGAPLEGCTTYALPSTHGTSPADVASEDAIVAALYEAISGPACQHRDWDRFRGLFAPGGRLIPKVATGGGTFGILAETPEEYAATVKGSMEELGFSEKEVSHVGESFNGVVHRFSTYESRRAASDATPFARGINSIQLLNDGKRWWVVTVFWAGERPDAMIPDIYLKRP
jgi:hypothetical protein